MLVVVAIAGRLVPVSGTARAVERLFVTPKTGGDGAGLAQTCVEFLLCDAALFELAKLVAEVAVVHCPLDRNG